MSRLRMVLIVWVSVLLGVGCASRPEPAHQAATTTVSAEEATAGTDQASSQWAPLDARLSSYDYPYPVAIHPVQVQGRALEMAYMDVRPEQQTGATVLLLHGKNFSGAYWADTIAALVEAGHRVVVPDQVGFGKSSKPTDIQYSFQMLADSTLGLLDALAVEAPVVVVGHSMGGMLATRFSLMHPERTAKLVLVNPIGLEDWKRVVPWQPVSAWKAQGLAQSPADIKAYMQKNYFAGQWRPEWDALVEIQAGWAIGPDAEQMAEVSALTYDMIFTQPVLYEFPDLEVPTLLIIGQRDRTALGRNLVPPEVAQALGDYPELGKRAAAAIPNATLVELDDVGHAPQAEAFDRYREALLGFVGE